MIARRDGDRLGGSRPAGPATYGRPAASAQPARPGPAGQIVASRLATSAKAALLAIGPQAILDLQALAGNAAVRDATSGRRAASGASGAATKGGAPDGTARGATLHDPATDRVATTVQRGVEDRAASHPRLARGSEGADVETLQGRLNDEGVADPALDPDGKFGRLTDAAVRTFQARHGLLVDGIVGLRTWGVLDELDRRGIAGPTSTALDDITPVDAATHATVEGILHPSHPGGGTETGPAMTDTGRGGLYEREVVAALDRLAADVIARPVATPAVDMGHANRVGDRAQEEVESFFGSEITLSSRAPSGDWHPGSTRMGLADATTRPVSEGDILGWTDYFMDNGSYEPAQVAQAHHYDGTRARPDKAEHDRVRDVWLGRGGRAKATQMIRSWPAEAGSGTVFLQLRDPAYQNKVGMWDLFATMVHEFLHLVTHPNYSDAAEAVGGGARDILVEGMDEHMKTQVWRAVRGTIASDTAFRTLVEGPFAAPVVNTADYEAGSPIDQQVEDHHYDSMTDADQIASTVGEPNARAAYFMGHVEAIGLGRGSASEHSLGGLASWTPGGGGQPDQYVVPPAGETVDEVRRRTGSTHVEDSGGMVWVDGTHRFGAGETLRIPGLRWHTAIAQDTRAQVANQHGIEQADLERANRLPPAPGTARIPAGTVLMIPVRP